MMEPVIVSVMVRVHGDLSDFVARADQHRRVVRAVAVRSSLKDVIEAIGVPHPEIGYVVVAGTARRLDDLVAGGEQIEVYPLQPSRDMPTASGNAAPEPRFVLDVHLGRLAVFLRRLGFDTLYRNDLHDHQLARIAADEPRILLTRDRGLLKHAIVRYGAYVRSTDPRGQIEEVVDRFNLWDDVRPFIRCTRCNGWLVDTAKHDVAGRVPERVWNEHNDYRQCQTCGQVYWHGSHAPRIAQFVHDFLARRPVRGGDTTAIRTRLHAAPAENGAGTRPKPAR